VHLGVFAINSGACANPKTMLDVALRSEGLGYESLWAGEHVVLPSPRVPPSPLDPSAPLLDPIVTLSALAAVTTRIRLGTGIIILPQRNPVVLAKELASLDVVSGGRLLLGIGVGYLEPEFAAVGVPFEGRGRRADEYLEAMHALWSTPQPEYAGRYVQFAGIDAHPRPVQQPLPVLVGGATPAAFRRAVERGHGWYGFGLDVEQTGIHLAGLREAQDRFERPDALGRLEITVTPPIRSTERTAYEAMGVDRLVLVPSRKLDHTALLSWLDDNAPFG
jgi:probable F420-dependent oxidoreductase